MTDPNTFSYSFSVNPAPQRPQPDSGLFAVDELNQFPLGNDQLLARNPRNGREIVVPADHLNALTGYCSVFRTVDEHVAELMKGSDGSLAREAAIRKVVESSRDGGLTISAAEICGELAPTPGAESLSAKPVVVIITCDRPQALKRLLDSITANCDMSAVDSLFVIDDSRSAGNCAANRDVTRAADGNAAIDCHYFGAAEACELTDKLIAKLPHHEEALRFLIDRKRWKNHKSYGLARNLSQLVSVGKPVVVFDDDAVCEVYEPAFRTEGVSFTAGQPEAAFYRNHDEWRQNLARHEFDPVSGHMRCLGLQLPEALSVLGLNQLPQESLRPASVSFAHRLAPTSRVLITECGTTGDPGTGSNLWLANMPAASRERLATTADGLQIAQRARCCWLGRPQPVFSARSRMSLVTGFDNRSFLPPYFPITRGEDKLFGQMTGYIYPQSVVLDYPWAVPHLPIPERRWSPADNRFAIGSGLIGLAFNDFFGEGTECLADDPQERLAFLARRFEDLAGASDATLLNRLATDRIGYKANLIRKLRARIKESADLSEEWRNYLAEALSQVESSDLGEFKVEGLKDMEIKLAGVDLLNFWRNAWRGFGRSLTAWNDIRNAAREIVARKYG